LIVAVDVELQDLTNNNVLWKTENLTGSSDFAGGPDVDITKEQDNADNALQTVAKDLAERVWALSTEAFDRLWQEPKSI